MKKVSLPLTPEAIKDLKMGDEVLLTGKIYTGRDQAHLRFVQALDRGDKLPIDIKDQTIYYVGPTPERPGTPIGAAGPTTSSRMDPFAPRLIEVGLRGIIGKGPRNKAVIDAIVKFGAVYFIAIGGAGAYLAKRINSLKVVAYEELGPESVKELTIVDFPVIVAIDSRGNDIFKQS